MDIAYLKKLVRILENSAVDEIEVEEEGLRVRLARNSHHNNSVEVTSAQAHAVSPAAREGSPAGTAGAPIVDAANAGPRLHEIKSPIVGTFYRAPAPDADPYVEIGQVVEPKTVMCIIEAMKLMNEIESDVAGRLVKIMVDNGKPVEYNQTLFLIEPV